MQIDYVVHSSNVEKVVVTAKLGDREVSAMVDGLTVELVGQGEHTSHGHTFRFVPLGDDDMKAHQELFAIGNAVRATFTDVTVHADPEALPEAAVVPEASSESAVVPEAQAETETQPNAE